MLDGIKVQARNKEMTYGTVIKYPPHFAHLYSSVLGNRAITRKPINGGITEKVMKYMRRFFHLLHVSPIITKYMTEVTLRGMSRRIICKLVKPKEVVMMDPKVVRPPLGTELRNALIPANQKQGSIRHSRACSHFHCLVPVRS